MRLRVVVREGDWLATGYTLGRQVVREMTRTPGFSAEADSQARWRRVHGSVFVDTAQVSVPEQTTIRELTPLAWAAARDQGRAWPLESRRPNRELIDVWLADPFTFERLPDERTLAQLDLHDGDLLVLCVLRDVGMAYLIMPARDPEELFSTLLLGSSTFPHGGTPRLWGALLYTEADAELAAYVRTHFDELNALTGPVLRVFVIERPADWSTALRYWRRHLEKPLLRVFATMRWLRWLPFDQHRAHDIARALGVRPDELPCLVLFRGVDSGRKLVFPIESATPAYLRTLFGAICEAARVTPRHYDLAREYDKPVTASIRPDADPVDAEDPDGALRQVLRALPRTAAPRAELGHDAEAIDRAAFDRVAAAEHRVRETVRKAVPAPGPPVVVLNTGSTMSENFHFHGPTTFVNRPVDTVIRDFQNNYGSAGDLAQLGQLLRLVLTSTTLSEEDREKAATAVHDAAGDLAAPAKGRASLLARLKVVGDIVARASDIVLPATEIIKNLTQM